MKIYVGSLPYRVSGDDLKGIFEEYGEVSSSTVISDKYTGRSKGFGFVEMTNETEAKSAIEQLNGAEIEGRTIVVNEAIEKQDNFKKRDSGAPRRDNFRKSY
jgi:RNA recognition motif-containing protein